MGTTPPWRSTARTAVFRGHTSPSRPAARTTFGGFRYSPTGAVEALFEKISPAPWDRPQAPLVELTDNGGTDWSVAPYGCPVSGPCVSFGPELYQSCGMHPSASGEALLVSLDRGEKWVAPPLALSGVSTCTLATLVALSASEVLLVQPGAGMVYSGELPIWRSTDGGRTWHVMSLPALPGATENNSGGGNVVVLPDGDLLAVDQLPWLLLERGSSTWCEARRVPSAVVSQWAPSILP